MKKINGTEKQIYWAEKHREKELEGIEKDLAWVAKSQAMDLSKYGHSAEKLKMIANQAANYKAALLKFKEDVLNHTDAQFFFDIKLGSSKGIRRPTISDFS